MIPATRSHPTVAWLQLHCCVLLWGFTAILGKLITLNALALVWWRVLLVTFALLLLPHTWQGLKKLPIKLIGVYLGIGMLVGLHWLCFYGSIKLANASIAATTLALGSLFVAFFEPWLNKQRTRRSELLLSVAVLPGIALVVGGTPERMYAGLGLGVLSAIFAALFGSLNKHHVLHTNALTMTCLEMVGAWILVSVLIPLLPSGDAGLTVPDSHDVMLLLVLSVGCTLLPFSLVLHAMRHISAFGAMLTVNLEPVYTIVLSALLFSEQKELNAKFYVGVSIVLMVVFVYPLFHRKDATAPSLLD